MLGALMKFLSLWAVCVAAADFPIPGLDISCIAGINDADCVSMAMQANHLAARSVNCNKVTGVLSAVKALGGPASAFCSSYLRIPATSTVTSTVTPPGITNTITETDTSTVTVVTPIGYKRRDATDEAAPVTAVVHAHDIRAGIWAYPAQEISSACSCLSLKPKATKTITVTASPPPPVNSVVTSNVIVTVTTCTTPGGPCNCGRPGDCCNAGCSCNDIQGQPVSTCL